MHAIDHRIGGVVAIGKLNEVTKVDKRHDRLFSNVAIIGREQSQGDMARRFEGQEMAHEARISSKAFVMQDCRLIIRRAPWLDQPCY